MAPVRASVSRVRTLIARLMYQYAGVLVIIMLMAYGVSVSINGNSHSKLLVGTSTSSLSPFDTATLTFGRELRSRHRDRIAKRLSEIGAKEPKEVPPWAFKHEIYLWDWYTPYFPCLDRERIGRAGDGGKWVCGVERLQNMHADECAVYSFGVRGETSFEVELTDRTRCVVQAFDPSVDDLPKEARGRPNIIFHKQGLGTRKDANRRLETLEDLMEHHGDRFLRVLKIDIERAEMLALPAMLNRLTKQGRGVPFEQLLLEIHHTDTAISVQGTSPNMTFALMEALEAADILPFSNELNYVPCINGEGPKVIEYSFLALRRDPLVY